MLAEDRIPNERLNLNQRLSFLIKAINETPRGKEIFLSRADPQFVVKLFAREVPEIGSGSVEIKAIAREPGVRTKVAVFSSQTGVDPVGSCVGQKGVRVQAVTNEIGGERVDVIPWNDEVSELIKSSLSPAEGIAVILDKEKKIAKVSAPEDQLSMAIGKDGQNVRLTAKLTGWRIEVEGNGQATLNPEPATPPAAEELAPVPVVKKITKTKAKKLAKKAKAAKALEPVAEVQKVEPVVEEPGKEEVKPEDNK
jgi:N utilization substance protein A